MSYTLATMQDLRIRWMPSSTPFRLTHACQKNHWHLSNITGGPNKYLKRFSFLVLFFLNTLVAILQSWSIHSFVRAFNPSICSSSVLKRRAYLQAHHKQPAERNKKHGHACVSMHIFSSAGAAQAGRDGTRVHPKRPTISLAARLPGQQAMFYKAQSLCRGIAV
jgi:hypothetical protein